MGIPDDLPAALARLGRLDQGRDASIRPVLLRVVVDLFLQKHHHAPDELTTFEAMVGPLLETADPGTRQPLMERLYGHPAAPAGLLDRYLDDESLIAAEVYRHASLSDPDLLAAAEEGSPVIATAVAHRPGLPAVVVAALAARTEHRITLALAANPDAALAPADLRRLVKRAQADHALAELLASRAGDPLAIAPLFPLVSPTQRRRMIDAVRRMDLGRRDWGRPDRAPALTLDRLDRLVLGGEWDGFDHLVALTLGCDHRVIQPLLHDGTGDILALALTAIGMPAASAARAFILGEPRIGHSVATVRRLTRLVDTVPAGAARRLIGAMIDGRPEEPRRSSTGMPAKGSNRGGRRPDLVAADPSAPHRDRIEARLRG